MNTITIHGKQYCPVVERVKAALASEGSYQIMSSDVLPMGDTGRLYCRVSVQVGERTYWGSSELKLTARAGSADGDAPLECAETSAVGRALGFAGIGLLDSIASADELRRVENGRAVSA
jgi:hypothetical protein